MTQNQQFEDAMRGLKYGKDTLDPARSVVSVPAASVPNRERFPGFGTTTSSRL